MNGYYEKKNIISIINLHLIALRKTANSSTNRRLVWLEIYSTCQRLKYSCSGDASFLSCLFESWLHSPDHSFEEIRMEVEKGLQLSMSTSLALALTTLNMICEGMSGSGIVRKYVPLLQDAWSSSLTGDTKQDPPGLPEIESTASTVCLCVVVVVRSWDGFRAVPSRDALHWTLLAIDKLKAMEQALGPLRNRLSSMVTLARIRALHASSPNGVPPLSSFSLHPALFTSLPPPAPHPQGTVGSDPCPSPSRYVINLQYFLTAPPWEQWLGLRCAQSLGLHRQAILAADLVAQESPTSFSCAWWMERAWSLLYIAVAKVIQHDRFAPHCPLLRDVTISEEDSRTILTMLANAMNSGGVVVDSMAFQIHYRTGVVKWLSGGAQRADKGESLSALLACAKLDPSYSPVYSFIGHYYSMVLRDQDRAVKCYVKALSMNPLDREAGLALSQLYIEGDDEKRALKLWTDVAVHTVVPFWSLCIKAHYHLCKEEYPEAVSGFQLALEVAPDEGSCWHGLGVAYAALRQHTSAHKALGRAVVILPDNVVVWKGLASSQRQLGLLSEALESYDHVLRLAPDDTLALKGGADVCLSLCYERYTVGWHAGAARSLSDGIERLERAMAVSGSRKWRCLWKLLGDLCTFSHFLGPSEFSTDDWDVDALVMPEYRGVTALLRRGEVAYRSLLELCLDEQSRAEAWYDIGCNLYHQAHVWALSRGQGSGMLSSASLLLSEVPRKLMTSAAEAFASGLRAQPLHTACWNGLSLCAVDNRALRYLAALRATQTGQSPAAMLNLHQFFSVSDHPRQDLAQHCFGVLQLMEPNPLSWVALGVSFEMGQRRKPGGAGMGTAGEVACGSALDAYQAALEIAKPTDALLGAAISWLKVHGLLQLDQLAPDKLLSVLSSPFILSDLRFEVEERMKTCLRRRPCHPSGWALVAHLCEQRKDGPGAVEACKRALLSLNRMAGVLSREVLIPPSADHPENILYARKFIRGVYRATVTIASRILRNSPISVSR